MGVYIPAGFALATLSWQVSGNTHVQQATWGVSPPAGADAQDVANLVDTAWGLAWANLYLSNQYTWLPTKAALRLNPVDEPVIGIGGATVTGSGSFQPPAPHTCALVHKRTAFGGRDGQGRSYLVAGYLDETKISSSGQIDGAQISIMQDKITDFMENVVTADAELVLLHENEASVPRPITAVPLDSFVATQRRRLRS
jgi:hypothetical protein